MVWQKRFTNDDAAYNSFVSGEYDDYPLQLSPLHEIVLGLSDAPLQQQLELDTSHINSPDWQGQTPLTWASLRGDASKMNLLIENGADIGLRNYEGKSVLYLAAQMGSYECVKILLDHGADVSISDKLGQTALHTAARSFAPDSGAIIALLCSHAADLEAHDVLGWAPLHFAADSNNSTAISSLVECGSHINYLDPCGFSAFGRSILRGHIDAMVTLYIEGATLNWDRTRMAGNVLGLAALYGSIQTMDVLATMNPGKRIVYNPSHLYDFFGNNRARFYTGPEEDPDELLAAFENLITTSGTPNPNMKYSDEDYPSESDDEHTNDSEEESESDSDSTAGNFQDAVEVQEAADLI